MSKIFVGTCGFSTNQKKYFQTFDAIEINSTFYNLPKIETVKRWKEQSPVDFIFSIKAPQLITHPPQSPTYRKLKLNLTKPQNYGFFKNTDEVFTVWHQTYKIAKELKTKFVLFQTPNSFNVNQNNIKNLKNFFTKIKRDDILFCIELRGDWKPKLIEKISKELDLIPVTDPLSPDTFQYSKMINYFRLHGGYKDKKIIYSYIFSDEDLKKVLHSCNKKFNYVFFNNVRMFIDALRFKKLIK